MIWSEEMQVTGLDNGPFVLMGWKTRFLLMLIGMRGASLQMMALTCPIAATGSDQRKCIQRND